MSVPVKVMEQMYFDLLGAQQAAQAGIKNLPFPVYNVVGYGADPTGVLDSTVAIQAAINACPYGGMVVFPIGNYLCNGQLTINQPGITLMGITPGPFEFSNITNMNANGIPMISITYGAGSSAESGAFITIGTNLCSVTIENLLFYYPNQVAKTATTPIAYPPTIYATQPNSMANLVLKGLTFWNSYIAIDLTGGAGRARLSDLNIGAYYRGIIIDHTYDTPFLSNIRMTPYWDAGVYPSTIDTWCMANGIGLTVMRCDGIQSTNLFIFSENIGILLTDSADAGINPRQGCGEFTNVWIEQCVVDINIPSSQVVGYDFVNINLAGIAPGECILMPSGGIGTPSAWFTSVKFTTTNLNTAVMQYAGSLDINQATMYGVAPAYAEIFVHSGSKSFRAWGIDFITGQQAISIDNAITCNFIVTGCVLNGATWSLPATPPAGYRLLGNIGITDH